MDKHKAALREILRRHRIWVESDGAKGERLDLSGADLRKARFEAVVFDGADMSGALLRNVDVTRAVLRDMKTDEPITDCRLPRFRAHRALRTHHN